MSNVDPHADTVPAADAPCDIGKCQNRWKHRVVHEEDGINEELLVCEEHYEEHKKNLREIH